MGIIQTTKELRSREETDHYPTPIELCKAAVSILPESFDPARVIDPGAGQGPWGYAVRQRYAKTAILGVEMDVTKRNPDLYPWQQVYDAWDYDNYLDLISGHLKSADLVIGNPPYGRNADGTSDRNLAEKFVKQSFDLLRPEGYLVFLLRLGFLEGQRRAKHFWPKFPLKDIYVLSRRPSFTGDQRTDATSYGLFVWQKGYVGPCYMNWLVWDYDSTVSGHHIEEHVYSGLGEVAQAGTKESGQENTGLVANRCPAPISTSAQNSLE